MTLYDWEAIWGRIYSKVDVDALEKLLEKAKGKGEIDKVIKEFLKAEAHKDMTNRLERLTKDDYNLGQLTLRAALQLAPEKIEEARPKLAPETVKEITKVSKDIQQFNLVSKAIGKLEAKGVQVAKVPEKVEGRGRPPFREKVFRTKTTFQDAKGTTYKIVKIKGKTKSRAVVNTKTGRFAAWVKLED